MKFTFSEGITYIALYMIALRVYGRLLSRFYFFHMPFTRVLEWGITIALLIFFIRTINKHKYYVVRMIYFLVVIMLPYMIRLWLG